MDSSISVTPRPYWLGAWLLRPLARPFVVIDGVEHRARWGADLTVPVTAGPHTVGAGIRYRGFAALLGIRLVTVETGPGHQIRLKAQNGLFNAEPFYITAAQ